MTKPKEKFGMWDAQRERRGEEIAEHEATEARLPLIHRDLIRATNFQAN